MIVTDHISVPGPVDFVLHFASAASLINYVGLPIGPKLGSPGTLHALGLGKDQGARYLMTSASEIYGEPEIHPQLATYLVNTNSVGQRDCYKHANRFAEEMTWYPRDHIDPTRPEQRRAPIQCS